MCHCIELICIFYYKLCVLNISVVSQQFNIYKSKHISTWESKRPARMEGGDWGSFFFPELKSPPPRNPPFPSLPFFLSFRLPPPSFLFGHLALTVQKELFLLRVSKNTDVKTLKSNWNEIRLNFAEKSTLLIKYFFKFMTNCCNNIFFFFYKSPLFRG